MSSLKLTAVPFVGFLFLIILQLAHGHSHDISPAEGPSNDGEFLAVITIFYMWFDLVYLI